MEPFDMAWFARLGIGRKLGLGFGVLGALIAIVGIDGIVTARQLDAVVNTIYAQHAVPALELKEANTNLILISRAVRNAILDSDSAAIRKRQADITTFDSTFRKTFAAYQAKIVLPATAAQASATLAMYDKLRPQQDAVVGLALAGNDAEARERLKVIRAQADSIDTLMDALVASKMALMQRAIEESAAAYRSALLTLIALVVVALVIAVIAAVAISRPIIASLAQLRTVADALARGDVRQTVQITSQDELGVLGDAMTRMLESQKTLAGIATQVSAGDLATDVTVRSEHDALGLAFRDLQSTMRNVLSQTGGLVESARAGRLEVRGDAAGFRGAYFDLMTGLNALLDAVVQPIHAASAALARVADRDLTARVTADFQGDFAQIKHSINTAAETLAETLAQVHSASDQVASAGKEIADGSQALAHGSSEQAASLEEVGASLEELSALSLQTAANTRHAQQMAETTLTRVAEGRTSMDRLSSAIENIKQSSDQTARIVKTIDEIAFQTNLLALNAAVEAARAGDAGRGFAVVADEVRSLAIRSAEAARNTADLIEGSVRNAEDGVALNKEVLAKLGDIDTDVQRVASVVAEIASAGEQQRDGVQQINKAVEQLNAVTQQVAANAEESASASEELAGQAITLTELVGTFTLDSRESRRPVRKAPPAARTRRTGPVQYVSTS
jgi:methyl-accepting chemotaxis protein